MLKGFSPLLTGDILKVLCDMGHGDELVIADANFPAYTVGQRVISCPGIDACTLLREIVKIFPLDYAVKDPAIVLDRIPEDIESGVIATIWDEYTDILREEYGDEAKLSPIPRQDFYDRTKKAYVVIQSGETRQYGDLLLVKGVVR